MLNIGEAHAVNELLDYILGKRGRYPENHRFQRIESAGAILAKGAFKALSAGHDEESWRKKFAETQRGEAV